MPPILQRFSPPDPFKTLPREGKEVYLLGTCITPNEPFGSVLGTGSIEKRIRRGANRGAVVKVFEVTTSCHFPPDNLETLILEGLWCTANGMPSEDNPDIVLSCISRIVCKKTYDAFMMRTDLIGQTAEKLITRIMRDMRERSHAGVFTLAEVRHHLLSEGAGDFMSGDPPVTDTISGDVIQFLITTGFFQPSYYFAPLSSAITMRLHVAPHAVRKIKTRAKK